MPWLRFETRRGINLDQVDEWSYEDKPVGAQPTAARPPAHPPRRGSSDSGGEAEPPETPPVMPAVSLTREPPQTMPTLHLLMVGGREITLEGEDATKALGFFVGMGGAV